MMRHVKKLQEIILQTNKLNVYKVSEKTQGNDFKMAEQSERFFSSSIADVESDCSSRTTRLAKGISADYREPEEAVKRYEI